MLDFETAQQVMVSINASASGGAIGVVTGIAVTDVAETSGPVAVDDAGIAVYEDATTGNLWERLLANDTDADGDALEIVAVDTPGTAGTVRFDAASRTLTYAADAASQDALGPDDAPAPATFTYTVSDGTSTSTATATIDVQGVIEPVLPGLFIGTARGDVLQGTARAEGMAGRGGNDLIIGAGGVDVLDGGAGADTFVFGLGGGRDVIADFRRGQDAIDARAVFGEAATHADVFAALDGDHNGRINGTDGGAFVLLGSLTIALDAGGSLTLAGVRELTAGDFGNLFAA
jgi:hypothetical protein